MKSDGFFHRPRSKPVWTGLAALLCLSLVWIATPSPEYFLRDPDGGNQLAGAQEMARFGGASGRTFDHTSGPLRFAVSAGAQLLAGHRLIGELLLVLLAYSAGYLLLFLVAVRSGAPPTIAMMTLAVALFVLPRFHKYYVVLLPAATLFAIQLWLEQRRFSRLLAVAAVTVVATMYRHDYGAFGLCAAAAAILLSPSQFRLKLRQLATLAGLWAGGVGLALLWLVGPAGVVSYLGDRLTISASQAAGMSLPNPLIDFRDSGLSAAFAGYYFAAALALAVAWRTWRQLKVGGGTSCAAVLLPTWAILASVSLIQSAHRADLAHLLQGVPVLIAGLPFLLGLTLRPGSAFVDRLLSGLAAAAIVTTSVTAGSTPGLINRSPVASWRSYRAAVARPTAMAERLPKSDWARLAVALNRCTAAGERVIVWPFAPQLHYFSERPLGSRLPILGPGFFTAQQQRHRALAALAEEPPRLILWDTGYAYDGRPQRRSVNTHPGLFAYVRQAYVARGEIEAGSKEFTIWIRRGSDDATAAAACLLEGSSRPDKVP